MHIHIYIYIYISIDIYVYMYIYTYMYIYIYIYLSIECSVYARVCLCICVCMRVCVNTRLHAYIRMIRIFSPGHVWEDMLSIVVMRIYVVTYEPETKGRRWQQQHACSKPCACAMVTCVFVLLVRQLLHHA